MKMNSVPSGSAKPAVRRRKSYRIVFPKLNLAFEFFEAADVRLRSMSATSAVTARDPGDVADRSDYPVSDLLGLSIILRVNVLNKAGFSECADATIERLTSRRLQNSSTRQRRQTSRYRPATTSHPAPPSLSSGRAAILSPASWLVCAGG